MAIKKRKYLVLLICLFTMSFSVSAISAKAVHVGHAASLEARKDWISWELFGFSLAVSAGGETGWSPVLGGPYLTSYFHNYDAIGTPWPENLLLGCEYKWQLFSASASYFRIRGYLISFKYTVSGRFYEKDDPNDYCDITIWLNIEAGDSFGSNDWSIYFDSIHLSDLTDWSFQPYHM